MRDNGAILALEDIRYNDNGSVTVGAGIWCGVDCGFGATFSAAVAEIDAGKDPGAFDGTRLGRYRIVFVDHTIDGHVRFITRTNGVSFAGFVYANSPPDESRGYFTYQPLDQSWYRTIGA